MFLLDDAILNNKMNNKDTIKIPKSCIITTTTNYLFIYFLLWIICLLMGDDALIIFLTGVKPNDFRNHP